MSKLLYQLINPPISLLLKSPLHSVMSSNTLIVEFIGRKSGNTMRTPISYCKIRDGVHCFTARSNIWWRNLEDSKPVRILIKGRWYSVTPEVVLNDDEMLKNCLEAFLLAVPRDAAHSNVRLDKHGTPDGQDIEKAVGDLVLLIFRCDGIG